jgi:16S rRNA (guanine527-N7)-methyltransferase
MRQELGLQQRLVVITGRAEELGKQYRGQFKFATARAFGPIDLIAELSLPLLEKSGYLFAPKSTKQQEEESQRANLCLPLLGGKLEQIITVSPELTGKDQIVLVVQKVQETKATYPRSFAQIKRQPLGQG